jgi:hypothetical protein
MTQLVSKIKVDVESLGLVHFHVAFLNSELSHGLDALPLPRNKAFDNKTL